MPPKNLAYFALIASINTCLASLFDRNIVPAPRISSLPRLNPFSFNKAMAVRIPPTSEIRALPGIFIEACVFLTVVAFALVFAGVVSTIFDTVAFCLAGAAGTATPIEPRDGAVGDWVKSRPYLSGCAAANFASSL